MPNQHSSMPKTPVCVCIENNQPRVYNIPEGSVPLLLCQISGTKFGVLYGPKKTCVPEYTQGSFKMIGAKLAIGAPGLVMNLLSTREAYKSLEDICLFEFEDGATIIFDSMGNCEYCEVPVEKVFHFNQDLFT